MSYILDALKKSDRERNESASANFSPKIGEDKDPRINFKTLFIWTTIILAVNLTSAYFLIGHKVSSSTKSPTLISYTSETTPTSKKDLEINGSIIIEQADLKEFRSREYHEELIVPPFTSLPENLRNELLPFHIDSHIYADEKILRLIKIGRVTYFEGDYLRPNLKLERITSEGVILNMSNRMFSLNIKDTWNL
tara:strand:- start:55 stop:636 length:582 start_codon:yes stop_codon:yes gene_type:complete